MFFSNVFSIGDGSAFGRGTRGYSNILHCLDGGIRNEYDTAPAYDAFIEYFLTVNPAYLDKFYEYVKEYIRKSLLQKITGNLERLRVFPKQEFKAHDVNKYSYSMLGLTNIQFEYHVHVLETYPSQETLEKAVGYWEEKCAKETWYTIDAVRLAQLEWEISIIPEEYTPMGTSKRNEYALWKPVPGQEEQFYQILLHPEKTFPHPRVAIPHPQRPYADIRNEIANDIANLPKFTARVKIALDDTQNVEHMIKTLAPGQVIARSLPQRMATIQAQNRKPDQFGRVYCRSRKEVEAEITNRQSSWDGSSPARPQQQARHARQVPVQGKCQNCGASNSPGSQFCNQCGTKL